jgi:hypothetical protein
VFQCEVTALPLLLSSLLPLMLTLILGKPSNHKTNNN